MTDRGVGSGALLGERRREIAVGGERRAASENESRALCLEEVNDSNPSLWMVTELRSPQM